MTSTVGLHGSVTASPLNTMDTSLALKPHGSTDGEFTDVAEHSFAPLPPSPRTSPPAMGSRSPFALEYPMQASGPVGEREQPDSPDNESSTSQSFFHRMSWLVTMLCLTSCA
ncbi:hypothetical protein POSPLADRAFT_1042156 [Postia placenta MAD-698-R-SB12]|uniref:Uncharacterized protein n=1 Tax=Postia placenta MAD-698-R-SB12 TaxID=670580 RepID=A0A1X6NDX8_9APHY|nr:hypothetical protein POSPLADRAFT_1042156 [Postia placenta MAD-698-R-SB12]OSX66849.1 hypothetical protein POSPLADRAFT_1042156 [Postia placenta MAD-698-R-SB12]